jgi:8-oxo-dGTP pyrophosphatase MutT (NUDIX family)
MFQAYVPHHATGAFTSHRKFLADKEYGEALDCLVKACSDMLLLSPDGARVLVGKRRVQPQPDWWFVGGRIFPGETPVQSCCRLLKRELSLEIAPDRFETVCCQSFAWGMRQQPPMEHGTTDSQVVLSLRLTVAEMSKVVLDPKEYDEFTWLEPDAILTGPFHPALKFAVSSLLGVRKLRALQAAVVASADDAAVAALARDFCALAAAPPPTGKSEYRVVAPALGYECDVTTALV